MVAQTLSAAPGRHWLATVHWWDLADSAQTVDSLLACLHEGAEPAPQDRGAGRWLWDRAGDRWGRVLFRDPLDGPARPDDCPATELIGYPPTDCWSFELEDPGGDLAAGQEEDCSPGV